MRQKIVRVRETLAKRDNQTVGEKETEREWSFGVR